MKKIILSTTMVVCLSLLSNAQIKMDAAGDVAVGQHWGQNNYREFDVRGRMFVSQVPRNGTSGYNYTGCWFETYVNGSNEDPIMNPQWSNTYYLGKAGSQFWNVHSYAFYATNVLITSDARFKENFQPVVGSLAKIMRMKPYTYDFKFIPDTNVTEAINQRTELANKNHIGFKAQDLQVDFPNLVKYDKENDKYSVNYIGLIPELVSAIQEQNQIINNLQEEIRDISSNCCNSVSRNPSNSFNTAGIQNSTIDQNNPNPFNSETKISYSIAETANNAVIYVYDFNGKQIKKHIIENNGQGIYTIQKNTLSPGQYYYTLLVDGQVIGTKNMIITD